LSDAASPVGVMTLCKRSKSIDCCFILVALVIKSL